MLRALIRSKSVAATGLPSGAGRQTHRSTQLLSLLWWGRLRIRGTAAFVIVSSRPARASEKLSFYHCFGGAAAGPRTLSFDHCFVQCSASPKSQLLSLFCAAGRLEPENSAFLIVLRSLAPSQKNSAFITILAQPGTAPWKTLLLSLFCAARARLKKINLYQCFGSRLHRLIRGGLPPLSGKLSLYHGFGSRFPELPCAASSRESTQKSKTLLQKLYSSLLFSTLLYCAVRRAGRRRVGAGHARRRRSLRSASMIIYRPMRKALVSFLTLAALGALALTCPAQQNRGYYRFPALHGNTIVFTSE